jgi:hypothetical protein
MHENLDIISNNEHNASADTAWLNCLPEEIRSSESLAKFKDISSLARSYLEAEKSLNSRVAIPKGEAPEEEWRKFYSKLGLPEDKKYLDTHKPEDAEYLSKYEEMFYNSGLSKRQGERLLNSLYGFSQDLQKQQTLEAEKARNDNIDWLKSSYGNAFDTKMSVMQAALSKFGSKQLAGLIEESAYSPALVDLLVRVGESLQPDSLVTVNSPASITSSDQALQEIKSLESDKEFMVKLHGKNHAGHAKAVARMEQLYKIVYDQNRDDKKR